MHYIECWLHAAQTLKKQPHIWRAEYIWHTDWERHPSQYKIKNITAQEIKREERENQKDATIKYLLSTSVSGCFGHHYAHLQENKDHVTAYGALLWFCWMWLVAVVGRCVVGCEHCTHPTTQRPTTATNHIQQNQSSTPYVVTRSLFSWRWS